MQFFQRYTSTSGVATACRNVLIMAAMSMAGAVTPLAAQCTTGNLAVIVNNKSSVESLSTAQLRRLLLGDVRNWPDQKPVTIVTREPSSKVAQCVLAKVVRLSDAEYRRYLMSAEFRGEDTVTEETANTDTGAARLVSSAGSSFAVIDAASLPALAGQVKILHINGKLPGEAGYPL